MKYPIADTDGQYTLIDMHVPPGGGPPPHPRYRTELQPAPGSVT